jgi:hypothetical protein
MSTFNSRLQEFINSMDLNASGFANALGYDSPEKIYRLLRDDKNKPSFDIIQDISNKFAELNLDWLVSNKGNMLNATLTNNKNASKTYDSTPLSSVVNEPDSYYRTSQSPIFLTDFKSIKEMRESGNAAPYFVINMPAYVGCSVEQCHATTLETLIPKESWLFISKIGNWESFLENGRLYMVALKDSRKLFYKIEATYKPGTLHLAPLNNTYPPIHLDHNLVDAVWVVKGFMPPPLIN